MRAHRALAGFAAALAALTIGCGSDRPGAPQPLAASGGATGATGPAPASDCVASFNAGAAPALGELIGLTRKRRLTVGTYVGNPFAARNFDRGPRSPETEVRVPTDACVLIGRTRAGGDEVVYLMASTAAGAWHRIPADPGVPLMPNPERALRQASPAFFATGKLLDERPPKRPKRRREIPSGLNPGGRG